MSDGLVRNLIQSFNKKAEEAKRMPAAPMMSIIPEETFPQKGFTQRMASFFENIAKKPTPTKVGYTKDPQFCVSIQKPAPNYAGDQNETFLAGTIGKVEVVTKMIEHQSMTFDPQRIFDDSVPEPLKPQVNAILSDIMPPPGGVRSIINILQTEPLDYKPIKKGPLDLFTKRGSVKDMVEKFLFVYSS